MICKIYWKKSTKQLGLAIIKIFVLENSGVFIVVTIRKEPFATCIVFPFLFKVALTLI